MPDTWTIQRAADSVWLPEPMLVRQVVPFSGVLCRTAAHGVMGAKDGYQLASTVDSLTKKVNSESSQFTKSTTSSMSWNTASRTDCASELTKPACTSTSCLICSATVQHAKRGYPSKKHAQGKYEGIDDAPARIRHLLPVDGLSGSQSRQSCRLAQQLGSNHLPPALLPSLLLPAASAYASSLGTAPPPAAVGEGRARHHQTDTFRVQVSRQHRMHRRVRASPQNPT